MRIELGKSFSKKLKGRIERFEFEVGVLEDKPHRNPIEISLFGEAQPGTFGTYAGGPVRKTTRETGPLTIGEILVQNMTRLNINLLSRPFQERNSDIIRFTDAFLKSALANKSMKRVENLLQAIVRNPILRGEYGRNKAVTADAKGFDRHLIDTGQTFKAIKARARRV